MLFHGPYRGLGARRSRKQGKIDEALGQAGRFPAFVWDSSEVKIRGAGMRADAQPMVTTHFSLSNSLL